MYEITRYNGKNFIDTPIGTLTLVSPYTKQGTQLENNYIWGTHSCSLYDAYQRPSQAKINAWNSCWQDYIKMNGREFKITGHNCDTFSVAFLCNIEGFWETGEALIYFTRDYTYCVPVDSKKMRRRELNV